MFSKYKNQTITTCDSNWFANSFLGEIVIRNSYIHFDYVRYTYFN